MLVVWSLLVDASVSQIEFDHAWNKRHARKSELWARFASKCILEESMRDFNVFQKHEALKAHNNKRASEYT